MKALGAALGIAAVVVIIAIAAGALYLGGNNLGQATEQKGRAIFALTDDFGDNTTGNMTTTGSTGAGINSQVTANNTVSGNATGQGGNIIQNTNVNVDVRNVLVTVNSVKVHNQDGWVTVSTTPQTIDIARFRNSDESAVIADVQLFSEQYDQIQIEISNVIVVNNNGQAQQAIAPTNTLVFNQSVDVRPNATAMVVLDIQLSDSLHYAVDGRPVFIPVVLIQIFNGPVYFIGNATNVQIGNVNTVGNINVPQQVTFVPIRTTSQPATSVTVGVTVNGTVVRGDPVPATTIINIVNNKIVVNVNQTVIINPPGNQTGNQTIPPINQTGGNQTGNQTNQTGGNQTNGTSNTFVATLSGANEVLPNNSTGTGQVTATIDGTILTVNGTFLGLTSDLMGFGSPAHIHMGAPGEPGPIVFTLTVNPNTDMRSGTVSFEETISQDQVQAFRDGNMFVNVHTVNYPDGEIRGQLTPA